MQQKSSLLTLFKKLGTCWKRGNKLNKKYGFSGFDVKFQRGHPIVKVAIILSPDDRKAWIAAGSSVQYFGNQVFQSS